MDGIAKAIIGITEGRSMGKRIEIPGLKEVLNSLEEYREGGALELRKYREIGTIEECREAMDIAKDIQKKVREEKEKESEIPIFIECTGQETTANIKFIHIKELEKMEIHGMYVAVLYNIDQKLRPFPIYSKVRMLGKESMFYMGRDNELGQDVLIQADYKSADFWFEFILDE